MNCHQCRKELTQTVSLDVNKIVRKEIENAPDRNYESIFYVCEDCGELIPAFLKVGPRKDKWPTYRRIN